MLSNFAQIVKEQEPSKVEPLPEGKSGALLATYSSGVRAVVKPVKDTLPNGKKKQRGISVATHPYREVAYYELAKLLGFEDVVPETVLTHKAVKDKVASAQLFVPNTLKLKDIEPDLRDTHTKGWSKLLTQAALRVPKAYWRQLLALDIIAGTRDRHSNNVGVRLRVSEGKAVYRLVAWDNAVCFGESFKLYHNVFHKFIFRHSVNFDAVWPVWDDLTLEDFHDTFSELLSQKEIAHAYLRLRFFQDYPYRLPWKVVSEGHDCPQEFPDYRAYFEPVVESTDRLVLASSA